MLNFFVVVLNLAHAFPQKGSRKKAFRGAYTTGLPLHVPPTGWRKRNYDDHSLSYADALAKTGSIEATVRKRRKLFAGFVVHMGEESLPQRVVFGELVGGEGYSGGQAKDWMDCCLEEDMTEFGMKFKGWRKVAQKAGRWF